MGRAYKNFWSLNTDEAVVAGILRSETAKNIEVLMPLNAQMKDVDLVLLNTKSKKSLMIQVKGSRAFEPRTSEVKEYLHGSSGWFFFPRETISESTADWFVFIIYVIEQYSDTGRRHIEPHIVAVPTNKLRGIVDKYKRVGRTGKYNFFIWVDPKKKIAFDFSDKKYFLSDYLDKKGFRKLNKALEN